MTQPDGSPIIMYFDPHQDIAEFIRYALSDLDCSVEFFPKPQDGLLALRDGLKPSVIVVDIYIPKIPIERVLELARAFAPDVPVFLVSTAPNIAEHARRLGAVDYLSKPFDPQDFVEKIKRLLPQAAEY